jgi:uncharacterized protein YjdB
LKDQKESNVLTLDPSTLILDEGKTKKVTVKGLDAAKIRITWTTSNKAVADVDANGNVKAIGAGKATITAVAGTGKGKCEVTVNKKQEAALELDPAKMNIAAGKVEKITVKGLAAGEKVTWTSSDKEVATVDNNGTIRAVKPGKAIITATATTGSSSDKVAIGTRREAKCEVIVEK